MAPVGVTKMHADEVATDAALVRRLLAAQFPHWAERPIEPVVSYGTDHDIYRLGADLAARLPRIGWASEQAAKEAKWLPRLAQHLPLALPVPLAMGRPADDYPFDWSVCTWLPGRNAIIYVTPRDLAPLPPSGKHNVWSADLAMFDLTTRTATRLTSGITNNQQPTLCVP